MSLLRLIVIAIPLGACVASEPVGGTPGESETEGGNVPETHLVIADDCGIPLACDPMTVIIDYHPPEALECAQTIWGNAGTGRVQVFYEADGSDDGIEPATEEAFLLLADRRVIRQRRDRPCEVLCFADDPWNPWGPHEICEMNSYFVPDGNVANCEVVEDFTCDALADLLAQEPVPSVPCEERSQADCDGPLDAETQCQWRDDVLRYASDSCEPAIPGACVGGRAVGLECPLNPTCAGAGTEGVFFREHDDGTVDLYAGDGCWAPVGFSRCSWGEPGSDDPPGALEVGPATCDCACAGA